MMLRFTAIDEHTPGILLTLLTESYAGLVSSAGQYWEPERERWAQFDRKVFQNPATVGRCVFLSWSGDDLVGFGSFDPRRRPQFGVIGHNCILPRFRRRGLGKAQILEILQHLASRDIQTALVSTGEGPFFLPEQRMYLSCGFQERRRYPGEPDPRYKLIEYERKV